MPVLTIPIHEHGTPGQKNYPHSAGGGVRVGKVVHKWQSTTRAYVHDLRTAALAIRNGAPVEDARLAKEAQALLDAAEPVTAPLFRGTTSAYWSGDIFDQLTEGTVHDLTLTSFSKDIHLSQRFAGSAVKHKGGYPVLLKLKAGRAVDVTKQSLSEPEPEGWPLPPHDLARREKEHIMVGSYRVVRTVFNGPRQQITVELEPV